MAPPVYEISSSHKAAAVLENDEPPQSQIERFLGSTATSAALIGPSRTGKSSFAFQVCYCAAQARSSRPVFFIHCQRDPLDVARSVRLVPPCGTEWDYKALERVSLKQLGDVKYLMWFFSSIQQMPVEELPRIIVVDDLDRFLLSADCLPGSNYGGRRGGDGGKTSDFEVYSKLLALMEDAQRYISRRTGEACRLIVTMTAERASGVMTKLLARRLGMVLRISPDRRQRAEAGDLCLEEDPDMQRVPGYQTEGWREGLRIRYRLGKERVDLLWLNLHEEGGLGEDEAS